ncbi:hypothetical protein [Candidatus Nitrosocosmicus hydrocola]|uniref:hypothetical protein n=1 Tax=Candidatus Nitrosocosmicus hydrocola TaxID=1826872 RepID=UPI0011E59E53|nr:hypothetical protein [Candidatus Nitrosocosmicus hydrocola]
MKINSLNINISKKITSVTLFAIMAFTLAGFIEMTLLSESSAVAQERERERSDPITGCFKEVGETQVAPNGIQNWTDSIQNFDSLIPTDDTLTLINNNVVGDSGPVADMTGIWYVLINGNNTAHDRQMVLNEVDSLLASSKPGFTQMQQDSLSKCIATETNSLGPTPNY